MKKIGLYLGAAIVFVSCGPKDPKVSKQISGQVAKPEYEVSTKSFALDSETFEINYKGSVVFWKEGSDPGDLQLTLKQSRDIKDADRAYKALEFKDDSLWTEFKATETKIKDLNFKKKAKDPVKLNEHFSSQEDGLKVGSSTWLKNALAAKNMQDKEGPLCDAALLKFATSSFFLSNQFTKRPIPFGPCEKYFEDQGYFKSDACKDNANGSDYRSCFWSDSAVAHENSTIEFLGADGNKIDQEKTVKLISGKPFKDFLMSRKGVKIYKDGKLLNTFSVTVAGTSAKKYLSILRKLDRNLDDSLLTKVSLTRSEIVTYNDRVFNIHRLHNQPRFPQFQNRYIRSYNGLVKKLPEVYGNKKYPNVPMLDAAGKKKVEAELVKLEADKVRINEARWKIKDLILSTKRKWLTLRDKSAKYLIKKDLVSSIWPYLDLVVTKTKDILMVKLQWDEALSTQRVWGCFDLAKEKPVSCVGTDNSLLDMEFDKDSGIFNIALQLKDPASFGLKELKKKPTTSRFQDFTVKQIKGKKLQLDLFPRKYSDKLEILTGKVSILDGEDELHQGSITMSRTGLATKKQPTEPK